MGNLYNELKAQNVVDLLRPVLENGRFSIRHSDGKFVEREGQLVKDTQWIHTGNGYGYECSHWHRLIFDVVSRKLKKPFTPRNCQKCWKVAVKPRTLEQLFELLDIQKRLGIHCKCGIETRSSVHGLYGGYFYNKGKENGLKCYARIFNEFKENKILHPLLRELDEDNKTTRIVLKRGCTEMEHFVGPSDKWEVTAEQNAIEDLIDTFVIKPSIELKQPPHIEWNVKQRWIEFAWQYGDPTYAKYTNGEPLYPKYVTYHPKLKTKEK